MNKILQLLGGGEHRFLKNVIDVFDNIKTVYHEKNTKLFPQNGRGRRDQRGAFLYGCLYLYSKVNK